MADEHETIGTVGLGRHTKDRVRPRPVETAVETYLTVPSSGFGGEFCGGQGPYGGRADDQIGHLPCCRQSLTDDPGGAHPAVVQGTVVVGAVGGVPIRLGMTHEEKGLHTGVEGRRYLRSGMPNRLAAATSPYLLQHQDNPVDWWEWGDEAFEQAKARDVPILLSVGYAACHWCHVMAHESFEDEAVAALMNELFVNVKVDREERPDVDSVYMEALQAMTGQGGWPMTVWIDHDGRPFYAGTYFPKEPRHGMPGFIQVMQAVSGAWSQRRDEVTEQASRLTAAIAREIPAGTRPHVETLAAAYRGIESDFDPANGGFGRAPKFPQQPVLDFLLRAHSETWAPGAGRMVSTTLERMAAGGIHDQLGGGFARYSVDPVWLVPHFEKMLYDNALLARLFLWAGVEFGRDDFIAVARSTIGYLVRDLRHPEGGFFSSEDADSEGVEGKFYVWTPDEMRSVLGESAQPVMDYYGVREGGNFEGASILSVVGDTVPDDLDEARAALLAVRSNRVRPGLDDKVIVSWNGLAIRALAEAGAVLGSSEYLDMARETADFILENLYVGGHLMRSWREGKTSVGAFLDDHASLALGLFALYAATGEERWYMWATDLVNGLETFQDGEGGFFSTAPGGADLPKRPRDLTDNPLPSGNAMASEALLIAALYAGDERWRSAAESALASAGVLADRYPTMVGHHLAVAHAMTDTRELAIVGPGWGDLAGVYWERYRPGIVIAGSEGGSNVVPLLEDRPGGDPPLAYVCRGFVCDLPTSDQEILRSQLG